MNSELYKAKEKPKEIKEMPKIEIKAQNFDNNHKVVTQKLRFPQQTQPIPPIHNRNPQEMIRPILERQVPQPQQINANNDHLVRHLVLRPETESQPEEDFESEEVGDQNDYE